MSNGETNTRDDGVVGAYRAASATLDEQPQAATRAAILAAAARAVNAEPQDVHTGATSLRQRRVRGRTSRIGPSRRPLALVASFLVATVALVLATRTNEERSDSAQSAVASKATEQMAANTPAAPVDGDLLAKSDTAPTKQLATSDPVATDKVQAAPAEAKPAAPPAQPARMQGAEPQSAPPAPSTRQESARRNRELADAREPGRDLERAATRASSGVLSNTAPAPVSPAAVGAGVAAAPPAPAATPPLKEERSKDTAMLRAAGPRAEQRAAAETDAAAPEQLAKARPVERTPAMSEESVENDPVRWMERIIALRDAGRDDDADRELVRLRERYVDVKVPENALRRTGTR